MKSHSVDDLDLLVTKRISVVSFPEEEAIVRSLSPTQRADIAASGHISFEIERNVDQSLEHDFWLARWRAVQVLRENSPHDDRR